MDDRRDTFAGLKGDVELSWNACRASVASAVSAGLGGGDFEKVSVRIPACGEIGLEA